MAGIALLLALIGVGCSSGPGEALPFAEPATTVQQGAESDNDAVGTTSVDVVAADGLIAFQATWLCELQRRTFPDLQAADAALDERLVASGLARSEYDEFLQSIAGSQELRDEVLSAFSERCSP